MESVSIKEKLLAMGMKETEFDSWQSDLYVKVTPISKEWLKTYEYKELVDTFNSDKPEDNGALWYEIPFGFMNEYLANRERNYRKNQLNCIHGHITCSLCNWDKSKEV